MSKLELQADSVEELAKGGKPKKEKKVETTVAPQEKEVKEEVKEEPKEEVKEEPKDTSKKTPKKETTKAPAKKQRKIDLMTPLEQITLHAQRNTHSVQKADKDSKKELYASQHVFVEEGEEEFLDTESIRRREEWLELVASAQENRILKGTITSITEVPSVLDPDDPEYVPEFMAKVRFKTGEFSVNIPSFVLYYYNYRDLNKAMALDIQKNMMRRLGAEIDFVVRYADEKTGEVIGDRLAALSMRGIKNYTSINGRKPNVMVGELVQAKIIAIAREYITVDAAGAEIRIPLEEISWLYMADARDFDGIKTSEEYKVGGHVNVKILSVETEKVRVRNSNYTLVKATGSIKQAKTNPRLKYFDEFKPGDLYAGVITGITETGVYVNLDNKMDCVCKFPSSNRRMPIMGESVIVRINSKDEEKKFLYGSIK